MKQAVRSLGFIILFHAAMAKFDIGFDITESIIIGLGAGLMFLGGKND
ncbi:TPA: hypothetical protein U1C44_001337 [Streptococcus suis]|nr:hypothetical protein [Streptococcus suis]